MLTSDVNSFIERTDFKKRRHRIPSVSSDVSSLASSIGAHPVIVKVKGDELHEGVMYEYYKGEFDALPEFSSLVPSGRGIINDISVTPTSELISFDTNLSSAPSKESGNFALRFTCMLKIPTAGVWTFYLLSNDGSALYLSGKKIVSNDGSHYAVEREGKLRIREPGLYPLTILYFHRNGKILEGVRTGPCLSFSFYFSGTGWLPYPADHVAKQVVPASSYFYDVNDEKTRLFLSSVSEAEACNYELQMSYEQSVEAELQDLSSKVFTLQKTLQDFYQRFDKLFKKASEQPLARNSQNSAETSESDLSLENSLESKFASVERHLAGLQVKLEENASSIKIQDAYEQVLSQNIPVDEWPKFLVQLARTQDFSEQRRDH